MRKIIFLSTTVIAFLLLAFRPVPGLDEVVNALRNGDVQELSKYFDDNLQISVPDKSDNFTKAKAAAVLKDFFNSNSVTGFDVLFKGEKGGGQYCIGNLKTKSGVFRTTVLMKTKNEKQVIKQILFKPS